MNHNVVNTGTGAFHDVIEDFDNSGRVVVASCQDVSIYDTKAAYLEGKLAPRYAVSVFGECIEDECDEGYVRSIVDAEKQLTVNHVLGCSLHVTKATNA